MQVHNLKLLFTTTEVERTTTNCDIVWELGDWVSNIPIVWRPSEFRSGAAGWYRMKFQADGFTVFGNDLLQPFRDQFDFLRHAWCKSVAEKAHIVATAIY